MPTKLTPKNHKILLITQMYPSGRTGTSVKTRNTIEFLQKKGFRIDVCCTHHNSMIKNELDLPNVRIFYVEKDVISRFTLSFMLRAIKVVFSKLPFRVKKTFDKKLFNIIEVLKNSNQYQAILYDGFSTLQYAREYDKKAIYIDDEDISDLMSRRLRETLNPFLKLFFFIEYYKCKQYERTHLNLVSQIWAISRNSAKHLSLSTVKPVKVMPTVVQTQPNIFSPSATHIVFTGLLSWMENINGLKWFLKNIWPEILASKPETELFVIGQKADPQFISYLENQQNVRYLGYVEKLEKYYQKSALAIAPLLINCGIKVKVVTYLSYGVPVVGLPESVWGMASNDGVEVASQEEFAKTVLRLLSNPKERAKLSKLGYQNIEKNHSEAALEAFLKQVKFL